MIWLDRFLEYITVKILQLFGNSALICKGSLQLLQGRIRWSPPNVCFHFPFRISFSILRKWCNLTVSVRDQPVGPFREEISDELVSVQKSWHHKSKIIILCFSSIGRIALTELVLVTKQEGKSYCSYNSFKSGYDITLSLGFFWLMGSTLGRTV